MMLFFNGRMVFDAFLILFCLVFVKCFWNVLTKDNITTTVFHIEMKTSLPLFNF